MTKKIVDTFNENLSQIKKDINNLYGKSKTLYLSQLNKSFTSYLELNNIKKEDDVYEDTFQTFNKIEKRENIVYDNDGFNLKYNIIPVEFDNSYYTSTDGDINMNNGEIIAGSFFGYIFNRSKGFWGYKSVEETNFSITLNLKKESLVNKIKFNTNNEVTLKCYIQTTNNGELEIGEREGKLHSWNFKPDTITSIRITGYSNLISVDYVECGLASYNQNGYLLGVQNTTKNYYIDQETKEEHTVTDIQEYEIKDLYNLKLTADVDTPVGTSIDFKYIYDGKEYDFRNGEAVLPEGYKVILNQGIYPSGTVEGIIVGDVFTSGDYKCFRLYKDYVEDSLEIRYGYNEWQKIDTTYDVSELVVFDSIDTSHLDSEEYIYITDETIKLEEGCIKQVYQGTETFELNTDYIPDYRDIKNGRIYIKIPSTSKLLDMYVNDLKFVIIGKKKEILKQYKCYVYLNEDDVINVQPFEACNMEIRHVVIDNNIEKDETLRYAYNDYSYLPLVKDTPTVQVQGYKGINMIEFTKFTDDTFTEQTFLDNDYLVIQNYIFYPFKYKLKQVNKLFDNPFEYTIKKVENFENETDDYSNYYLITVLNKDIPESVANINNFTISYLRDMENIQKKIKIKANFISTDGLNTPTLRGYKLENTTKSVSDLVLEDIKNKLYSFKLTTNYTNNNIDLYIDNASDPLIYKGETPDLMFKKDTKIYYEITNPDTHLKMETGTIYINKDENINVNLYYTIKIVVLEPSENVNINIYKNDILYQVYTQETQEIKFDKNELMRYEITKEGYIPISGTVINSSLGSNNEAYNVNMDIKYCSFILSSTPVEARKQVYFIIDDVDVLQEDSTSSRVIINDIQEGTIIKYIITDNLSNSYTKTFKILEDTEELDVYVSDQTYNLTIDTNFNDTNIKIIVNGIDEYNFLGNANITLFYNDFFTYNISKNNYITEQGSGIMSDNMNLYIPLQLQNVNLTLNKNQNIPLKNALHFHVFKNGLYNIELKGGTGSSSDNTQTIIGKGGKGSLQIRINNECDIDVIAIAGGYIENTTNEYGGIGLALKIDNELIFIAGGGGFSKYGHTTSARVCGGGGYIGGYSYIKSYGPNEGIKIANGYSYDGSKGSNTTTNDGCGGKATYSSDWYAHGGLGYKNPNYSDVILTSAVNDGNASISIQYVSN